MGKQGRWRHETGTIQALVLEIHFPKAERHVAVVTLQGQPMPRLETVAREWSVETLASLCLQPVTAL